MILITDSILEPLLQVSLLTVTITNCLSITLAILTTNSSHGW